MNQKDKAHHVAKAATKAALYDGKAAEDKADIKLALVTKQLESDQKKNNHASVIQVNWNDTPATAT
jgi:hypothetical protein